MGEQSLTAQASSCIQSYKNCFEWTNIFLAFVAAVLGMAACASYSKKPGVQMNVPFMIQPTYLWTGTADPVLLQRVYYGLNGYTAYVTDAASSNPKPTKYTYNYSDTYDALKCGTNDYTGYQQQPGFPNQTFGCDALSQCSLVGKVSMAFTCLGFLTALLTMILCHYRRSADSWSKKLMCMLFSFLSMLCSVIAFGAFGACMSWVGTSYSPQQDANPPADCLGPCGSVGESNMYYPGPGGGLSLTSVVFFIIVFALTTAIPVADDAISAASDSGIDGANKA